MERLVIVGGGHVAAALLSQLQKQGYGGQITLLSAEGTLPVNRPLLSKDYLLGKADDSQLTLLDPQRLPDLQLDIRLDSGVCAIDRQQRRVLLQDGSSLGWDRLVLATGARLRQLQIPGSQLEGVCYLKTRADAERLRARLRPGQRLTVIGGGFIGLEIAASGRQLGLDVTLLEAGGRLLQRVADAAVAEYLAGLHQQQGVEIRYHSKVAELQASQVPGHQVNQVLLEDGSVIPTDLVVVGIGVEPDSALAQAAGLDCDNGVRVDALCQTSDPAIFAAGDCANRFNRFYQRQLRLESVESAQHQAAIIAARLCQQPEPADAPAWFWSTQYGHKLQMVGLPDGCDQVLSRQQADSARGVSWLYLAGNRLLACHSLGRPADFLQAKKLIVNATELDLERLSDGDIPLNQCLQLQPA
ncbi:NAD(P)/FAD-dependent oxidoreductase [Oceanobacter mangrovi]|uniref:NAD(P)/FAD-dependent oxidoreductase n=1 Tax=Oceanobacter mangrovi TaxID=2862510 RepID=UPI001C8ED611|nr:FAD-dependent oxidoreductase [Oceanobacter mangrovi]